MATLLIYSSIILASVATLTLLYSYFYQPNPTPNPYGQLQFSDFSTHNIPLNQILQLKSQFENEGKGLILTFQDKDSRNYYEYSTPYQPKCLKRPYVVFVPATYEQAQKAFKLILHHKQQFTIFSGGHDNECRSTTTQALLNTNLLKNIEVHIPQNQKQEAYAVIGAGVRWLQAYTAVKDTDYQIVGGLCPTVGVSGFTLGGGFNWGFSTFYGIGSENVLEMKILLPNGQLVIANWDNDYQDIMWGMLGSGGKNLGLALQFKFKLHHYPEKLYTMFSFAYVFSNDKFGDDGENQKTYQLSLLKEVYQAWIHKYKKLQNDQRIGGTAIQIVRDFNSGPRSYILAMQGGCKNCDWNTILKDLIQNYPVSFVISLNLKLSSYEYETKVLAPLYSEYPGEIPSNSGAAMTSDFSDNLIDQILGFFIDQEQGMKKGYQVQATHVKHAVKNPQRTSFAAPELKWKHSSGFIWLSQDQEESANKMTLEWNKMMQRGASTDYLGGYINYMDFNLNDYQKNYFNSTTITKLQEIKQKYDPHNVFANVRGIPIKQ